MNEYYTYARRDNGKITLKIQKFEIIIQYLLASGNYL